jgi:REP element-mobilizing transposase RayT
MTYLITFACYGCHLHGDPEGSVDRAHNLPGSRLVEPDSKWVAWARHEMNQPPYLLDEPRRQAVLAAIVDRCSNREWRLLATHVRTNPVHVLVDAEAQPARVMNDLKSFASRRLNELGFETPDRKRWARHGSTRWLWKREDVLAALTYVIDKQGERMAVYQADL